MKLLYDAPDPNNTFPGETRVRLWDDGILQLGPCGDVCVEVRDATVFDFDIIARDGWPRWVASWVTSLPPARAGKKVKGGKGWRR